MTASAAVALPVPATTRAASPDHRKTGASPSPKAPYRGLLSPARLRQTNPSESLLASMALQIPLPTQLVVLVVATHPDDAELGCGHLLRLLGSSGWRVVILVMTAGELGGERARRRREQRSAAALLQAQVVWGGFADGAVPVSADSVQRIRTVAHRNAPALCLIPAEHDSHQDHRNTALACRAALPRGTTIWAYEGPTSQAFQPTTYIAMTRRQLRAKLDLLQAHASQVRRSGRLDFLRWACKAAAGRAAALNEAFAEGFVPLQQDGAMLLSGLGESEASRAGNGQPAGAWASPTASTRQRQRQVVGDMRGLRQERQPSVGAAAQRHRQRHRPRPVRPGAARAQLVDPTAVPPCHQGNQL